MDDREREREAEGALVEQMTYLSIYLSIYLCTYLVTYPPIYPSIFSVIQGLTLAARHTCIIPCRRSGKRDAGRKTVLAPAAKLFDHE